MLWLCLGTSLYAQISFTELPVDMQVIPRDLQSNTGRAVLSGSASSSGALRVVVKRNGSAWGDQTWTVSGAFSKHVDIPAERANYDFTVYFKGSQVAAASGVVAGDVIVAHGQSNSTAYMRDGLSANSHQDPFVRAYGVQFDWDGPWLQAEGDKNSVISSNLGSVGQWALRLAKRISDEEGIPIAILNASRTGKAIAFFLRKESNPSDTGTNYGRLLTRADNAGIRDRIRAFIWYQGTSDVIEGTSLPTYAARFDDLYNDWMEDYPGLEAIYMMQVRRCQDFVALEMQEWQRQRVGDSAYPLLQVVSTNGLPKFEDNCHFSRKGHYDLADRLLPLLLRDLYGHATTGDNESPDVHEAGFSDPSTIQIILSPDQTIDVDAGVESLFSIDGSSAEVTSVSLTSAAGSNAPCIELTLGGDGSGATHVSYTGYQEIGAGPEVTNATGIGLLSFHRIPVQSALLPIEITSFTARADGEYVTLHWETDANESGSFEVQHAFGDEWVEIGYVHALPQPDRYAFSHEVEIAGVHRYRLRIVDADGDESWSDTVELVIGQTGPFSFSHIYPNPIGPSTKAQVYTQVTGALRVTLHDVLGRQVGELFDDQVRTNQTIDIRLPADTLPAGTYILVADLNGLRQTQNLTVIR